MKNSEKKKKKLRISCNLITCPSLVKNLKFSNSQSPNKKVQFLENRFTFTHKKKRKENDLNFDL